MTPAPLLQKEEEKKKKKEKNAAGLNPVYFTGNEELEKLFGVNSASRLNTARALR